MSNSRTLDGALRAATDANPDRVFLDFSGVGYTYAVFDREVERRARGLVELGVQPGDRVASLLENGPEAVLFWLAAARIGAIAVPINNAHKGEFLAHPLRDCGARVLVTEGDYVARVAPIVARLPDLDIVLHTGDSGGVTLQATPVRPVDELQVDSDRLPAAAASPFDVTALIYTSGTTGPSKGCMLSHNYLFNLVGQVLECTGRTVNDVNWSPLPLFHLNALAATVFPTLLLGGTSSIATRFSVSDFWPEIERTGATVVNLLGAMIPLIAQAPDTEESIRCKGQIRVLLGAPIPPELEAIWRDRFGVQQAGGVGYGLTEASLLTTLPSGEEAKPGSSGRRNDSFHVRLVDDADEEVPLGEVGEIVCRPRRPHVMFEGYWNRPDATVASTTNLWFHTGDLGRFDEDGYFYFVDRKKDYLRRRGENISSFEMEATYMAHPAISEVAVHAVLSELTEDDVKVTAVLKPDQQLTERELFDWSVDRVPYFALPRYIEFRSELPKNAVGRVIKYMLRDDGCTETTWDREVAGVTFERR